MKVTIRTNPRPQELHLFIQCSFPWSLLTWQGRCQHCQNCLTVTLIFFDLHAQTQHLLKDWHPLQAFRLFGFMLVQHRTTQLPSKNFTEHLFFFFIILNFIKLKCLCYKIGFFFCRSKKKTINFYLIWGKGEARRGLQVTQSLGDSGFSSLDIYQEKFAGKSLSLKDSPSPWLCSLDQALCIIGPIKVTVGRQMSHYQTEGSFQLSPEF